VLDGGLVLSNTAGWLAPMKRAGEILSLLPMSSYY
jgi:hypothetical protein